MPPKDSKDILVETFSSMINKIKPRILILCRSESCANLYNAYFVEWGCEPVNAWSVEGVIELFEFSFSFGRPFDLVCLDYHIHGMDGITLSRHLRAIDSDCLLHLFFTRNQYEADFLEEFEDFGGFFFKPSDSFNDLYRLIHMIRLKKGIASVFKLPYWSRDHFKRNSLSSEI